MKTLIWYLTTVMQCDLSLYVPLQILLRKISSYFTEFFPSSLVNGKSVFFTNGILYVGLSNCLSGIYNCILIDRMCKPESIIFDALVWFLQLENYRVSQKKHSYKVKQVKPNHSSISYPGKCESTCMILNRQRLANRKGIRKKTTHELQKLSQVTWKNKFKCQFCLSCL